jgi:hypothetical protein
MTLVLTELSPHGIVMAADSAITELNPKTRQIQNVNTQGWSKIIRVPRIHAAISYWGMIGAITQIQFDKWLRENVVQSEDYTDIFTFATHLAQKLNTACQNKPLKHGYNTGLHVAGFGKWSDGQRRPIFLHIHNAHLSISAIPQVNENGELIAIYPAVVSDPIKLFEVHHDFPNMTKSIEENLVLLSQNYITRNGDFFPYLVIWENLQDAFNVLNLLNGFSIPANPNNLGSRKDYLQMAMETVIRVYQCSNHKQRPTIGGNAISLGITESNYLFPIDEGVG